MCKLLSPRRALAIAPEMAVDSTAMAGDANKASDPNPYRVDAAGSVLQPVLTIPAAGNVVLILARPAVAIPLAVAVLALIGLSLVPASPRERHPATVEDSA